MSYITKKELINLYYKKEYTLEDIGWEYDLSRERIRQIMEGYGLKRLKHRKRRRKNHWDD